MRTAHKDEGLDSREMLVNSHLDCDVLGNILRRKICAKHRHGVLPYPGSLTFQ